MLNNPQNYKWLSCNQSSFNATSNTYMFGNQININSTSIHLLIKHTLVDHFLTDWRSKLQTSNKGKLYNIVKDDVKLEPYLILRYGDTLLASKGEQLKCILFQQEFP